MRKSIISIALCLVLLLSMSTQAFAAESGDIKVTYSQPDAEKVTVVDITWGSMEFNYSSGDTKVWNPDTLQYDIIPGEVGTWTPKNENGDTVTVTNHSNTGLAVTVTYSPAAENGVTGTLENGSFLLATAEGIAVGEAPKGSATLVLDNASVPAQWSTEGATTIGNITVKLEHCDVQVSTAEEFEAALANGGAIMLTADIALPPQAINVNKNTTIVLNGRTLTPGSLGLSVTRGCMLTVTGDGAVDGDGGLWVYNGTLNLQGGTVDYLYVSETVSNKVNISGGYVGELSYNGGTVIITGGTFGFDPTEYLAEGYTATEADGIWTVTAD